MKTAKRTTAKPREKASSTRKTTLNVESIGESHLDMAITTLPSNRRLSEDLMTVIEAKIDVGFGNQLFIRGEGPGLSWQKGTLLTCIDENTWRWMTSGDEPIIFKLLLNDEVWAQGSNQTVEVGKRFEAVPMF